MTKKNKTYNVEHPDASTAEKINKTNSSLIFRDIGPLLSYVTASGLSQDEILTFLTSIPNVRSLKSDDLMTLFEII
jgi:hypothetical protein